MSKISGIRSMLRFDNRWQLIVNRGLFRCTQDIYRLGEIRVLVDYNAGDANGVRECLSSPMYRDLLRGQHFDGLINVLDIGAHTGGFTLLCHHLGMKLGKVVSVELNPRTVTRLVYNLASNLHCHCAFENVALASTSGELTIRLGQGSTGDSIYEGETKHYSEKTRTLTVPSLTFDTLHAKYFDRDVVDLCKMDIEGAEHEVLSSPGHQRLGLCRYLVIELHGRADRRRTTLQSIENLGYRCVLSSSYAPDVHLFRNMALDS